MGGQAEVQLCGQSLDGWSEEGERAAARANKCTSYEQVVRARTREEIRSAPAARKSGRPRRLRPKPPAVKARKVEPKPERATPTQPRGSWVRVASGGLPSLGRRR